MSQVCFDGFYRLTEIRRAERLDQLKTLSLFPTVEMLEEIENKYGDVVSLVDARAGVFFDRGLGSAVADRCIVSVSRYGRVFVVCRCGGER